MLQPETHRVVWEEATANHWRQHTRTTPAPKTREQTEEKPTHTTQHWTSQTRVIKMTLSKDLMDKARVMAFNPSTPEDKGKTTVSSKPSSSLQG